MTAFPPDQLSTTINLLRSDTSQRFRHVSDQPTSTLQTSTSRHDEQQEDSRLWGSKRLLVAVFMFFGYFYMFMLRGNLSIAIVEMTSNKTIVAGNQTIFKEPEFKWDSKTTGWILGLFSYGTFFAVLGGYWSSKHGGVTVTGLATLITALLTMASPMALYQNMYIFAAGRIAEGLFENFAYAGICDIWSRWVPKSELPKILSFSLCGDYLSIAVTFPICGFIAEYYGWPMIFYFSGFIAVMWSMLLFVYVRNDPLQDKNISPGELKYIRRRIRLTDRKNITYPWKKILTSKPVWALCYCKFAYSWAQVTLLFCFPLYIKDITNQSTAIVGLLSGIPNYLNLFVAPLSGMLIDYLQNNRGLDSSKLQKFILAGSFSVAGVLFAVVGFSNFIISMMCFIIIVILLSVNVNILQTMIVSLSPDHAGGMAGISVQWYFFSTVIGSMTVGLIVTNHTWQEWSICFGLSGSIVMFAAIITVLFASCDDQKWSSVEELTEIYKYRRGTLLEE